MKDRSASIGPDGRASTPGSTGPCRVPAPVTAEAIADARARGLSARAGARPVAPRPVDAAGTRSPLRRARQSASHDPRLLPDADRALARVRQAAVEAGERVLVLGDFDADGLTGLAILVLALRTLGLDVAPYVPARTEEGHGLSLGAVETAPPARAGRSS